MTSYYPDLKRYSSIAASPFLKKTIFSLLIFPVLLLASSCTENPTIIGSGLLPGADFVNIHSTDTIVPRTYNIINDSIISSNLNITYSYFGGLYDPYFGNTYCDFVSQLRLTQKWPGGVPTVDSVKLLLTISGIKGDLTFNPAIQLWEITEQLYFDSTYYSKRDPHAGMYIGSFPVGVISKDTVTSLIAAMPNSFGEYLLRDTTKLYQEASSNDDFKSFFRGIYIRLGESSGIQVKSKGSFAAVPELLVFNPTSNVDKFAIRVYYHTPSTENSLFYDFIISDKSARYNRYFHDLTTADPVKKIKHVNDGIMDTTTAVQSFYGVAGKVIFPGLEYYKTLMPLSVNKARLIYNVLLDGDKYTTTTAPKYIYLAWVDSAGRRNLVQDYYVDQSHTFYSGAFSASSTTYSFNLVEFVQFYLRGKVPKPELEMYLPEGEVTNALLKSVGSVKPPAFTLVYTK